MNIGFNFAKSIDEQRETFASVLASYDHNINGKFPNDRSSISIVSDNDISTS